MNKDQQDEDAKLHEAANDFHNKNEYDNWLRQDIIHTYVSAIKSEAAEEYWQSQQSVGEVDVEGRLKKANIMTHFGIAYIRLDEAIDIIKPHLQPAKEESDAIELTVDNIQSIIERHVYAATMNEHDELIGVEEAAQAMQLIQKH